MSTKSISFLSYQTCASRHRNNQLPRFLGSVAKLNKGSKAHSNNGALSPKEWCAPLQQNQTRLASCFVSSPDRRYWDGHSIPKFLTCCIPCMQKPAKLLYLMYLPQKPSNKKHGSFLASEPRRGERRQAGR